MFIQSNYNLIILGLREELKRDQRKDNNRQVIHFKY